MNTFPYNIIDLTHTLDATTPSWDGSVGFQQTMELDYNACTTEVKFRVQHIAMHAGIGTHLDAPAHCIPNGQTVEQIPLQNLAAPCVVLDVSDRVHERYIVSVADIKMFESVHGTIQPHSFFMIRTGWEQFWGEQERYRNNHVFPCVAREAAQLLLERQIVGLGIDTLSPDRPEDGFPVHALLLNAGKYIVENAANLSALPPMGSLVLALPIKIKDGTESPIRLIALIHKEFS